MQIKMENRLPHQFFADRILLLNTLPVYYGGIENSISFIGFQLDFRFQFVRQKAKNVMFSNNTPAYRAPGSFLQGYSNQTVDVLNRWQKPGDQTSIQRYTSGNLRVSPALSSDAQFTDASFIRLKNVSLSWELPEKWRQKTKLRNCQIYIHGQNLLTFTRYKGLDPETANTTSLPPLKMLTTGIKAEHINCQFLSNQHLQ